jgi:hypothetical protein
MKKLLGLLLLLLFSIGILSAQHLKKDGTPDMRYKENKSTYSSSSSSSSSYTYPSNSGTHLKKDGTPDMRYKENKNQPSTPKYSTPKSTIKTTYTKYSVARDKNGKIIRSEAAKKEFMKQTNHPNGWTGHVIDHIIPLKKGGCDCPANMQWQTIEEAKAKDKWE